MIWKVSEMKKNSIVIRLQIVVERKLKGKCVENVIGKECQRDG